MRDLIVVIVPNLPADITRIRTSMGWGPPVIPDGQTAVANWGVWLSSLTSVERQRIRTHKLAGECRVVESTAVETHEAFLGRCATERTL